MRCWAIPVSPSRRLLSSALDRPADAARREAAKPGETRHSEPEPSMWSVRTRPKGCWEADAEDEMLRKRGESLKPVLNGPAAACDRSCASLVGTSEICEGQCNC